MYVDEIEKRNCIIKSLNNRIRSEKNRLWLCRDLLFIYSLCRRPHTAWQWLRKKLLAPKKGEVPEGRHPKYPDSEADSWKESEKEWYYYTTVQVSPVSDKRYDRIKALYIKLYGGWDTIDLEHTTYDGHAWW